MIIFFLQEKIFWANNDKNVNRSEKQDFACNY